MTTAVTIVDYDTEWPIRYAEHAQRIGTSLGARVLRLEHVGSTSVPGLAAKPVIDLLLVVDDAADEAAYRGAIEDAGFTFHLREPDWHQHRLFVRADAVTGRRSANLHVFSNRCSEIGRMLAFRDWLRANPQDRELYAATKRQLAKGEWDSVDAYARAKTDIVEQILNRARAFNRSG